MGIVGTNCSSAARAAIPVICNANIPMVSPSNTAIDLTLDTRPADYHCYLRTAHSDSVQGAAAARFAQSKGAMKAATVHDGSLYADQLQQQFVETFTETSGGTITAQEAIQPTDTEMGPMLTRIRGHRARYHLLPHLHRRRRPHHGSGQRDSGLRECDPDGRGWHVLT